jgi:putative FMN-binding protein
MYLPSHFEERDPERLRRFIREHPFGTLVTLTGTGLDANHIPFLLLPDTTGAAATLHGHIARANPLWRDLAPDSRAGDLPRTRQLHFAILVCQQTRNGKGRADLELRRRSRTRNTAGRRRRRVVAIACGGADAGT